MGLDRLPGFHVSEEDPDGVCHRDAIAVVLDLLLLGSLCSVHDGFAVQLALPSGQCVGADVLPFLLLSFEPGDVVRVELSGSDADLPVVHQHGCWIRPASGSHCRFVIGTLAVDGGCCQQPDSKVFAQFASPLQQYCASRRVSQIVKPSCKETGKSCD
jgi:hypothetical protein